MTHATHSTRIPDDVLSRIGGALALYRPDITTARLQALLDNTGSLESPIPVGQKLTIPQVAERLAVSTRTVWRMVKDGRLPSVRIGRAVRVPEAALQDVGDLRETRVNLEAQNEKQV